MARMAAPAAADRHRLTLADVPQRADEHDCLTIVADRVEHGEVTVGHGPADVHDLRDQFAGRRVAGRILRVVGHPCECRTSP